MKKFQVTAANADMGIYEGADAAAALDAYAHDAGYKSYADVVEQFGDDADATELPE